MRIGGEAPRRRTPFSKPVSKPWPASGDRHLGSSSNTDDVLLVSLRELVFSKSSLPHAARNTTPAGTSHVVTRRHKAISNLRARATIIVLRFLPPSVRVRYHWANALSF